MKKQEYGDFQTPAELADLMTGILKDKGISPEIIVEPTCGLGEVLFSADKTLRPQKSLGIEIQENYADIVFEKAGEGITVLCGDFFRSIPDIKRFVGDAQDILFIGNPPWVTNSMLSAISSENLPEKSNVDNFRGIEAITGKSNFDISECIIKTLIDNFSSRKSVYAFLCKISVAKKIMCRLWKNSFMYGCAEIYPIASKKYFSAAVDACFFYLDCSIKKKNTELIIFDSIKNPTDKRVSGFCKNVYLEDVSKKDVLDIYGKSPFIWRNGVKHDCAKVMELRADRNSLCNGYGEMLDIEDSLVFPYLKSSDLVKPQIAFTKKIIITQRFINEPTDYIQKACPKTWDYLNAHSADFAKRKSVIYKNKCRYSIFSVGDYTFRPYKIAISGLHKSLDFRLIKPFNGKAVLLDDTCNFISFDSEEKAEFIFGLLKSDVVTDYLNCRISWEAKRPVKTEFLNSIDFEKVSEKLSAQDEYCYLFGNTVRQALLFA